MQTNLRNIQLLNMYYKLANRKCFSVKPDLRELLSFQLAEVILGFSTF